MFYAFNPSKCTHSGQPNVQRPGSSRGLPVGAGIRTHNLGLPRVSSPTLYPLGLRLHYLVLNLNNFFPWPNINAILKRYFFFLP